MQKNVIIFGGTDGIGRELAIQLSNKLYGITIIGRNIQKGNNLLKQLQQINNNINHYFLQADLSLIKNLPQLLNELNSLNQDYEAIIHCADVLKSKRENTSEGLEVSIATNFYSRFFLNKQLLKNNQLNLKKIIHIAASGFSSGKNFEKKFPVDKNASSFTGHNIGQCANDFYGFYLSDLLKDSNIKINILNPGMVDTNIRKKGDIPNWFKNIEPLIDILTKPFIKSTKDYCKIVLDLVTGENPISETSILINSKGKSIKPSKYLLDKKIQNYLINTTEKDISDILKI